RYAFNFYPFWYLFNFGIGKITSIITILGAVMMFIKRPKIFFFLFAVTLSFFCVITYATVGGFYVRNFVTIIPIILIFPAYFLNSILNKKNKYTLLLFLLILTPMFFENFSKSIALVIDYSKPWNYKQIENWMTNIPKGSKIAAHPSVPLPTDSIRLEYNEPTYYSMEEFKEEGAEFSVTNLDWITNDYYDWMNNFNIIYAKKPVAGLESYYSAMATEELADYSIYNVFKSPFAPESNFIVEKIPSFNVSQKKLLKTYSNLNPGWKGEPIKVRNAKGIVVEGKIKNGYLFVNFYKYYTDIPDITKRIGTRVSSREKDIKFSNKNIISEIPKGATWAVVGFSQYKIADSKADDVKIFSADVKTDFSGFTVKKTEIPKDLLFPNSQGNL